MELGRATCLAPEALNKGNRLEHHKSKSKPKWRQRAEKEEQQKLSICKWDNKNDYEHYRPPVRTTSEYIFLSRLKGPQQNWPRFDFFILKVNFKIVLNNQFFYNSKQAILYSDA